MNSSPDGEKLKSEHVELINRLSATDGKLESPINLNISTMKVLDLNRLQWFNYDVAPKKMKLTNTGYTVILSAMWQRERAYLNSGPLLGKYVFSQIHFHWGKDEMTGSEHHIDGGSMPMELHAVHFNNSYTTLETALRKEDGVVVLVYLFKLQDNSNRQLDSVIMALPFIQPPHSSVRLTPVPLTKIIRPFMQDYFVYWGSMTTQRYVHSILWLISREPIAICAEQIQQFRTLNDERHAPILSNCRALQDTRDRSVFYICPGGSRYASLLPIARPPPPRRYGLLNCP